MDELKCTQKNTPQPHCHTTMTKTTCCWLPPLVTTTNNCSPRGERAAWNICCAAVNQQTSNLHFFPFSSGRSSHVSIRSFLAQVQPRSSSDVSPPRRRCWCWCCCCCCPNQQHRAGQQHCPMLLLFLDPFLLGNYCHCHCHCHCHYYHSGCGGRTEFVGCVSGSCVT